MGCNKPWKGYRWPDGTVRNQPAGGPIRHLPLELPCNRCTGCRIEKARGWAIRCEHEAQLWKGKNAFITLTISPTGLETLEAQNPARPRDSLDVSDWQKFAKRMRKEMGPFRFLHVGEYGSERLRPHYHALIFGQDFSEERCRQIDSNGNPYFLSPQLAKLWPWGTHQIKLMTPETISYVCHYTVKNLTGQKRKEKQQRTDAETGECWEVKAQYATMSRRPGIGSNWFTKYHGDLFPADFAVSRGKKAKVPRYYSEKLKTHNPEMAELIRKRRHKSTAGRAANNTPERRHVREEILKSAERERKRALD